MMHDCSHLERTIELNEQQRTLSLLVEDRCVAQQLLSPNLVELLSELFVWHASYCPYSYALSAFSQKSMDECEQCIEQARAHGTLDEVLRPLRAALHRCHDHLRVYGVDVVAVFERGYLLRPHTFLETSHA